MLIKTKFSLVMFPYIAGSLAIEKKAQVKHLSEQINFFKVGSDDEFE